MWQQGPVQLHTTNAIFYLLRVLMEKYRAGKMEMHCVFVDLKKAYDGV